MFHVEHCERGASMGSRDAIANLGPPNGCGILFPTLNLVQVAIKHVQDVPRGTNKKRFQSPRLPMSPQKRSFIETP